MYSIRRLIRAILSKSDAVAPFYCEAAYIERITYAEVKEKLEKEVKEYLNRNYRLKRQCLGKNVSYDMYLRDDATIKNAASYLFSLYSDREDFYRLMAAMEKI